MARRPIPQRKKSGRKPGPKPGSRVSPATEIKKGEIRNPGGMTKEVAALRDEARRIAAEAAPEAMRKLIDLARRPARGGAVMRQAADSVLDRALGRPTQPLDATVTARQSDEPDYSLLSDEELEQLQALQRKALRIKAQRALVDGGNAPPVASGPGSDGSPS